MHKVCTNFFKKFKKLKWLKLLNKFWLGDEESNLDARLSVSV
jgi:hypothetical protein